MVCTANELQEWKDFPKGLRVLLLDQDTDSASDLRTKLEAMDYVVSIFCNETEAVSAFASTPQSFHVAIVEVDTNNGDGTFKFLESAKELPVIMTSNIHCLSTMMKCIALGAVEFLRKPLSEDKLRNIWQHVVHKAFNAGDGTLPAKESSLTMLRLQLDKDPDENIEDLSDVLDNDLEISFGCDKYPAPSTPQLKQAARSLDDGDCQDQVNCSAEKESGEREEHDGETKSVETTCDGDDSVAEVTLVTDQPEMPRMVVVKLEEEDSIDVSKNEDDMAKNDENMSSGRGTCGSPEKTSGVSENPRTVSRPSNSCLSKSNRKKMKVDWTTELHKKFVHAVEQLGVDQAIPSRILELMKVEGLTRHNVASHLQKYRMHKRHILPKEDDRRWPRPREAHERNCYPQQPVMAFPTYHSNHQVPMPPTMYPMWGQPGPGGHPVPMWGPPSYPPWQPAEGWHWKPYPGMHHAEAWGCPVMPPPPPPHTPYALYPHNAPGFHNTGVVDHADVPPQNSLDLQPADEVIDKVVKEAINKPWLPLPLGLKSPSTDSVLFELSRQGISAIPPRIINPS